MKKIDFRIADGLGCNIIFDFVDIPTCFIMNLCKNNNRKTN